MSSMTSSTRTRPAAVDPLPPPTGEPLIRLDPGCGRCRGRGTLDPFHAHDGSPPFTWCPACLGADDDACGVCLGYGAVPVDAPCERCAPDLD